ncbi:hypothetical protein AURANDRAFT_69451, partial [Aureococcus anophagefferens]
MYTSEACDSSYVGSYMPEEADWRRRGPELLRCLDRGDAAKAQPLALDYVLQRARRHAALGARGKLPKKMQPHFDLFVKRGEKRDDPAVGRRFLGSFRCLGVAPSAFGQGRREFYEGILLAIESRFIQTGDYSANTALGGGCHAFDGYAVDEWDGEIRLRSKSKAAYDKWLASMKDGGFDKRSASMKDGGFDKWRASFEVTIAARTTEQKAAISKNLSAGQTGVPKPNLKKTRATQAAAAMAERRKAWAARREPAALPEIDLMNGKAVVVELFERGEIAQRSYEQAIRPYNLGSVGAARRLLIK